MNREPSPILLQQHTTALTIATMSEKAKQYAADSMAPNTRKAYQSALGEFEKFCEARGVSALPAEPSTLIDYFMERAERDKLSTLQVKRAAIVSAHQAKGLLDPCSHPTVKKVLAGIRRDHGTPPVKAEPINADQLLAIVSALPNTLTGARDRALILLGFAGAFRRSELVALDVADLHFNGDLKIVVRRSKTDQAGAGRVKTIPPAPGDLDPIAAVRAWLARSAISSGPLFRKIDQWDHMGERLSGQSVALILKRSVKAVGLDEQLYSGHSLRSGFVTAAIDGGASEVDIMEQTGHSDVRVLRGYVQSAGRGAKRATLAALGARAEESH
jgi:integrase